MMPASSPDRLQAARTRSPRLSPRAAPDTLSSRSSRPERGAPGLAARLAAWDETAQDLERVDPGDFSLRIRTDRQTPTEIAEAIRAQLEEAAPDAQPAQVR